MYEEGLSLRHYVKLLLEKWVWLAIASGTAILVVVAITFLLPSEYRAEATLAILRSRTQIQFDPRIQTLSDYELARTDVESRQQALVALVTSNEVVRRVLEEVSNRLEPDERRASALRGMVEVQSTGDLININVRYRDSETATQIANSWIQHYERYVNDIYSGSGRVTGNTSNQVQSAKARYEAAQGALERFTAEDPVPALQRQIDAQQSLLDSYQQTLVTMGVNPIDTENALLDSYYRELEQVEGWLADARALREQISADSGSDAGNAANSLSLILLRSRIFGGGGSNVANRSEGEMLPAAGDSMVLQVDLGDIRSEEIGVTDVDALIQVLEGRRENTRERIGALVSAVNSGEASSREVPSESQLMDRIRTIEDEISDLQGEVEAQNGRRRELEQARDRAWDTYLVLVGKQVEEEIAIDSPAAEVRIADMAIVPSEPIGKGLIKNAILAGIISLMFSATAFAFLDWWRADDPAQGERLSAGRTSGDRSAAEHLSEEETVEANPRVSGLPDTAT